MAPVMVSEVLLPEAGLEEPGAVSGS